MTTLLLAASAYLFLGVLTLFVVRAADILYKGEWAMTSCVILWPLVWLGVIADDEDGPHA